ncbi:hypothetical protein QQS21_003634 [Conoideocrella luteorostrata]|uniref:Malic acid transport protein n=1 Tax=Conoideocrella luteorostrata TaxID=1105319 RepID=A0AAJ0CVU6_9HYPO|nr:hypothetical protein QQS21_003634 [Conoideocrella luteorostrata]
MAASGAQMVRTDNARSNSPECGYESPSEQNQPGFFSSPSPTPSIQRAQFASPAATLVPSSPPNCDARPLSSAVPRPRISFNRTLFPSNRSSINHVMTNAEKLVPTGKVTLKDRVACYQWTYFTMTMATGGIANVLHASYYRASWITYVGTFFCLLNIALFVMNCILLCSRFYMRPGSFTNSFTDQVESLFIPAFVAHLIEAADTSGHPLAINKTAIALCATATQGTGCLIAFMISAAFIYRLMTQKLPRDMQRPGVFISIGPFAFTAAGIVQLGIQAKSIVPQDFLAVPNAADIIKVVSVLVGLWLWGLAMWFFLVSVGSLWKYTRTGHSIPFQMTWWSFVFPNTALVVATETMGDVFDNKGLHLFSAAMTIALIIVWIGVFITMVYCLRTRKLLWPKDVFA